MVLQLQSDLASNLTLQRSDVLSAALNACYMSGDCSESDREYYYHQYSQGFDGQALIEVAMGAGGGFMASKELKRLVARIDAKNGDTTASDGQSGTPGGYAGRPYELRLIAELGGSDGFSEGGRQFDGKFSDPSTGDVWYEAKSGNAWQRMLDNPKDMEKFKANTGQQAKIAAENGVGFRVYSEVPIPDSIAKWLDKKGIDHEWSE